MRSRSWSGNRQPPCGLTEMSDRSGRDDPAQGAAPAEPGSTPPSIITFGSTAQGSAESGKSENTLTILVAFGANLVIAVAKTVGGDDHRVGVARR